MLPFYGKLNQFFKNSTKFIPDKIYLQIIYFYNFHRFINFKSPKTFTEKLQWLKLNDRNNAYTNYVDKYLVREHIKYMIGEKYLIPLIGVWDNSKDIDFEGLPLQFVMKCNHDSASTVICVNKKKFDWKKASLFLDNRLKRKHFYFSREWPYKNIKPKIICEKFLRDSSGCDLKDYKVFCFHGKAKLIQVISGRSNILFNSNFFDVNWNEQILPRKGVTNDTQLHKKPENLNEILQIAEKLSNGIPFVRVDLYLTDDGLKFGELTFYPGGGFILFEDDEDDLKLGNWLSLEDLSN